MALSVDTYGRMRKRGIRVLPGGDYGFPTSPHGAYARDLQVFVDILGFSPMETLVAATKHGGEIMGRLYVGPRMNPNSHRAPWRTENGLYVAFYEAAGRVKCSRVD